ncbi:hypothetical protein SGPA1_31236 [Streptomyces misionensis JCM 4497]
MSTLAQGGLSFRRGAVRTAGPRRLVKGEAAGAGSVCRPGAEEAEPYVRAAHAGRRSGRVPGLRGCHQRGEPRLPLRVTLVHGVSRSINRPARRAATRGGRRLSSGFTRPGHVCRPYGVAHNKPR